ncbi:MAG: hypothetical protein ACRES7_11135 [Gammaproteobacteria bacterium]
MIIRLNEGNGGKMLGVHVSGKLTKADYEQLTPKFGRLVEQHGKIRSPFDMVAINRLSRFHLALGAFNYLPDPGDAGVRLREFCEERLAAHTLYIRDHLEDQPEITNWTWSHPGKEARS